MWGTSPTATFGVVAEHHDVIIVGSGAGGGTLAHTLAPSGKRILLPQVHGCTRCTEHMAKTPHIVALDKERNDTVFQKTLGLNDFYLAGNGREWPLGTSRYLWPASPTSRAPAGSARIRPRRYSTSPAKHARSTTSTSSTRASSRAPDIPILTAKGH